MELSGVLGVNFACLSNLPQVGVLPLVLPFQVEHNDKRSRISEAHVLQGYAVYAVPGWIQLHPAVPKSEVGCQ
eukprot:4247522-Pleurochrysis_carterae.AAC.2